MGTCGSIPDQRDDHKKLTNVYPGQISPNQVVRIVDKINKEPATVEEDTKKDAEEEEEEINNTLYGILETSSTRKKRKPLRRERSSIADWHGKSKRAMVKLHCINRLRRERSRSRKLNKVAEVVKQAELSMEEKMVMKLQETFDRLGPVRPWKDPDFTAAALLSGSKKAKKVCHITEMITNPELSPALFPNDTSTLSDDICQGSLGDCYFISALSVLADKATRVKQLFAYTKESFDAGISCVRINDDGVWKPVLLDHCFPNTIHNNPVYSNSRNENVLWVMLLEKAYAKLHSSYDAIESGLASESMMALTGAPCDFYELHDKEDKGRYVDEDRLWEILMTAKENEFLICTSTDSAKGEKEDDEYKNVYGLVRGHAYALLDAVVPATTGERMVKIRNPWGKDEWKGRYSDHSKEWSKDLLAELDHKDLDDGAFYMSLSDFDKHFTSVTVCRYRDNYKYSSVELRFTSENDAFGVTFEVGNRSGRGVSMKQMEASFFLVQQKKRHHGKDSSYEFGHFYFEIYMQSDEDNLWHYISSSTHLATRTVSKDTALLNGGKYFVVVRCLSSGVHFQLTRKVVFGSYAESYLEFSTSKNEDEIQRVRNQGLQLAISQDGEVVVDKNGSKIYSWQDEHGSVLALLFQAGPNDVFWVNMDGEFKNMVMNEQFPGLVDQEEVSAANGTETRAKKIFYKLNRAAPEKMVEFSTICRQSGSNSTSWKLSSISTATERCLQCKDPVGISIADKFSGSYYSEDTGKVHSECYTKYRISHAERCLHCKGPVMAIEDKYTGTYYSEDNGKIHEECWQLYQEVHAERCVHCNGPVINIEGKYSGRHYTLDEGGKVHSECWKKYKENHAEKCGHCKKPVIELISHFSGQYYSPEEGIKVHEECWKAYKKARQDSF